MPSVVCSPSHGPRPALAQLRESEKQRHYAQMLQLLALRSLKRERPGCNESVLPGHVEEVGRRERTDKET